MSAVVESWTRLAVDETADRSACGSGISVARHEPGPTGQNVSSDLPRVHCRSANCRSRAVTSLTHG